ncbi:MAG: NrfD/PsrC family molybdoenzyme membrane anchor subunit [Desulfobacterales bacterium]|nr:NrfD/PsrC family molybdoenzyme membrane anchor subunit [Desulfobacterales bacterium]
MLEKALKGSKGYYGWIAALLAAMGTGFLFYLWQLSFGMAITGMSRDVSWGFYIAQFTFFAGVAASSHLLALPFYLHDFKGFGKIAVLGSFLSVASVSMCLLFIFVDLGQPTRILNMLLYPTPGSVLFWDMIILNGHLILSIIIGWQVLEAERNDVPPPFWVKPLIWFAIPWAVGFHTVTAFLYAGLPGRDFWLSALLAPRFLASALASGPAVLILACLIIGKLTGYTPGRRPIQTLAKIVAVAAGVNLLFFLCEVFVAFYSRIPAHMNHFIYLFFGLQGQDAMVPWMWSSLWMSVTGIFLLAVPTTRKNETVLAVACVAVFAGAWIDKGMGTIAGGFIPSPLNHVTEYLPTVPEVMIGLGVWATGLLILTVLFKIAIGIRREAAGR